MRKKIIIGFSVLVAIILAFTFFGSSDKDKAAPQFTKVVQGKFEILVNVTGELKAQNSEDITAPTELRGRSFRISEVKIQDLIPEGTVVDSGAYVATLDRSALSNQLKSTEDELEKSQQAYLKVQLDTTLQLRELRNTLINLKFDMEEKKIVLEQSKYEPPATQRQAQINLDKAEREHRQASHNYNLKREQAEASMKEVAINLERQRRERQDMLDVLSKFVIRAPKPGMVIYYREWGGTKRKVGSSVSPWDLTVATLPDLSVMNSKTYVNEIDISKIKKNQSVRISVDAFPEKQFTGEVVEVANIGEQLPNTDAKVFEVVIRVNEYDPILRPSMTTGNQVITNVYDSVMYIPLEALHADDSVSYVFTKKGKKQVVVPGDMNENYIIVEKGLSVDDEIYISMPEKPEKFDLVGEELIPVLKEKALKKKQDEEKLRQDQEMAIKAKADAQKMMMQFAPGGSMVKGDKPANDTKKSDRGDRKRESK
ncbi:MAG TPA: HlyD family efflux transporter periplasmic adaptor subunit [Tenuifilaceae bacterium]|nr:HlyD family efflux transporter periplasmic adaptor subunit [Tenuifilaceae bacterium]HPN20652.1 HlyD family efflux transporter periplasmic adaptor subunit [Tenuifilaceae bacterium]